MCAISRIHVHQDRSRPGATQMDHHPFHAVCGPHANAIAALGRLGFSTDDTNSNFKIDLDIAEPPDFNAIADLMLKALHEAYGADADTKLRFQAPYAERATRKCVPTS